MPEFVPPQTIKEKISKLLQNLQKYAKEASILEQSIVIAKRKNGLLQKDVNELRRRREEQSTHLNKEENRIFSLAKELAQVEDRISQMEVDLESAKQTREKLISELDKQTEGLKEHELLLGLYEGCFCLWKAEDMQG